MSNSPYYFAEKPPPGKARLDSWPSFVLRGRQPRFHSEGVGALSIKMFLGGMARYRVGNGGAFTVDDSCYLVLNHGQDYTITIDFPTPVESFCLFFSRRMAEDLGRVLRLHEDALLDEPEATGPLPAFYERTYSHDVTLSPALFALRDELRTFPPEARPEPLWIEERMQAVLRRLLVRHGEARAEARGLALGARPATREELYRRLHQAKDFIAASFGEPLTLDTIAGVACLSPNHLLRTFQAAFQQTPHQYLTERRLLAARSLLEHSDLAVTEICLRVGFCSLGSFSHLFSRRVGVSPEAYRRQTR